MLVNVKWLQSHLMTKMFTSSAPMTLQLALLLLSDIQVKSLQTFQIEFTIIFFSTGSGAIALAHLDGNGTDEAVATMVSFTFILNYFENISITSRQVSRVNELALGYPEGRIELQLIGGFRDQQGYADDLFSNIMRKYLLKHCCLYIGKLMRQRWAFM